MWICLNDGFYSIVQDHDNPNLVWVRSRHRDHLAKLFPYRIEIQEHEDRDYRYRTLVEKGDVADIISHRVNLINYGNFKASVKDKQLHDLYSDFWTMHRLYQEENE